MRSRLFSRGCGRPNGSSTPNVLRRSQGGAGLSGSLQHRVAISSSRLIALHDNAVAFNWKDYRIIGVAENEGSLSFVADKIMKDNSAVNTEITD
jgi:hypothetical protein